MQTPTHQRDVAGQRAPRHSDKTSTLSARPTWLARWPSAALMSLLTVAAVTFCFAPWDLWPLAYVALVPWTVALAVGRVRWLSIWIATVSGLIFWATNLYWLTWVTPLGHVAGSIYLTVYWLAGAMAIRAGLRRRWPAWVVLPVVWVALEFARAHVLGFPWLFLGHSQYRRIRLIQIADLTGQYGVSFAVAMVNGVVVEWVLGWWRGDRSRRWRTGGVIATAGVLASLLGYGAWRVGQDTRSPGWRVTTAVHNSAAR